MSKVIGALVVPKGYKLPADISGEKLEKACHAEAGIRVRPIFPFVEYSPNGGEVQVSTVGYGAPKPNGVSTRTDTWTMDQYSEHLAAALLKTMNSEYDAYYFDEDNKLYGIKDDDGELAGIPMSSIYPGGAHHPTSGAEATQTINFCLKNTRKAIEDFDFIVLDFDPARFAIGLVPVEWKKVADNEYKLVESKGGFDRTPEFGDAIAATPAAILKGVSTGVSYNAASETLTITGTPALKDPSALYEAGIKGIIQL